VRKSLDQADRGTWRLSTWGRSRRVSPASTTILISRSDGPPPPHLRGRGEPPQHRTLYRLAKPEHRTAHQVLDRIDEKCALYADHPHAGERREDLGPGCTASQSRTSSLSTARSQMESSCSSSPTDTKTSRRFSASSSGTSDARATAIRSTVASWMTPEVLRKSWPGIDSRNLGNLGGSKLPPPGCLSSA